MDNCLKLAVLRQLSARPLSGYSLMTSIRDQTGWKPSPGSIYPLLGQLHKTHAVTIKVAGRRKVYSLTSEGADELKALLHENKGRFDRIAGQLKVCAGKDVSLIMDRLSKGQPPFGWLTGEMLELRKLALSAADIPQERRDSVQKAMRQLLAALRRSA